MRNLPLYTHLTTLQRMRPLAVLHHKQMVRELTAAGVPPLDAVAKLWGAIVDAEKHFDFLCSCVEPAQRGDLVNALTHERFKFNW